MNFYLFLNLGLIIINNHFLALCYISIKPLPNGKPEKLSNFNITFSNEYSYCKENYCYGSPFIYGKYGLDMLCLVQTEKVHYPTVAIEICTSILFDNFFGLLFTCWVFFSQNL